jgi:CheY-like chemotaxis protein/archaellum biogenesis ATPase FlaH
MQASGVAPIDRGLGGLEPGLPLVLAGPAGSGRTVLCLELAAAALGRGEPVTYLTAEPPNLLLRQAASLGLDLTSALRSDRFVLLELDPGAALAAQSHGADGLVAALRAEAADTRLWIIDPITSLTREILDERPLQALVRALLEGLAGPQAALVATADAAALADEPAVERALRNACGAYVSLARHPNGDSLLRVAKSRSGSPEGGELHFRIGAHGSALVDAAAAPAAAKRERAKVLVVDERRDVRDELAFWLSGRWDVVTAEDGVSALSRVLAERPDLIILDLHMSRIPGREILHSMRLGGVRVPVLVMTAADARSSDRVSALVLGATDIVTKPVDRFELLHRVEGLLRLPIADAPMPDYEQHLLSPMKARRSRSVPSEAFEERLERAVRFGEECGIGSSVIFVEAPSEADFDAFVAAADDALRAEDAILALSERRGVLLLVATEISEAPQAFTRLGERYLSRRGARDGALAWTMVSAADARAGNAEDGWKSFCQKLVPWPPAASD